MTFWDIVAPIYDAFEKLNGSYQQMISKTCELIPQGATVLELAGGTGEISLAISKKADTVLCTDISENMLNIAKRKAKKRGLSNVFFENISVFETGKQNNSFDVVVASQVLHLLDDPEKACREIKRITKNMAIIVIPLLKGGKSWKRFVKHELNRENCEAFLEVIGFRGCDHYIVNGGISLHIAVWRTPNEN